MKNMGQVANEDYVQLQLLNQKLQELDQSITQADQQIEHALVASTTLESLETAKPGQELLIPLGAGAFLEVEAKAVDKVKLVVGSNVLVDKPIKDTLTTIKSQIQELHAFQQKSVELYGQVVEKINKLQEQIESKMKE